MIRRLAAVPFLIGFAIGWAGAPTPAVAHGPGIDQALVRQRLIAVGLLTAAGAPVATAQSVPLLDGSEHTDTAAGTVVRGDLITGQTGTPAWTRLALGADDTLLTSDGTDAAYETLSSLIDSAFGSTQGQVLHRDGFGWVILAVGTNGQLLTSGGAAADVTWTTVSGNVVDTLAATLGAGPTTGGTDLTVTTGDKILGAAELTIAASSGLMDLDATGALSVNSSAGLINIGTDAVAQKLTIGELTTRTEVQVDALLVDLNAGASGMTLDSDGGISLDAGASVNVTVVGTGQDLLFRNIGSSAAISIDAVGTDANITIFASGGGADQVILLSTAGTAANAIDLNATAGGIDIDAVTTITITSGTTDDAASFLSGDNGAGDSGNVTVGSGTATGTVGTLILDPNAGGVTMAGTLGVTGALTASTSLLTLLIDADSAAPLVIAPATATALTLGATDIDTTVRGGLIGGTASGVTDDADLRFGDGTNELFWDASVSTLSLRVSTAVAVEVNSLIYGVTSGSTNLRSRHRNYSDTSTHAPGWIFGHARGTPASPTVSVDGDNLGQWTGQLWDGVSNWRTSGVVAIKVDGTPSATSSPGLIAFSTTPVGSVSAVERLAINNVGHLTMGADNTQDIGSVDGGTTDLRPRTIYVGTSIESPVYDAAAAGALVIGSAIATSVDISATGEMTTTLGTANFDEAVTMDTTLVVDGAVNVGSTGGGDTFTVEGTTDVTILDGTISAAIINSAGNDITLQRGGVTVAQVRSGRFELADAADLRWTSQDLSVSRGGAGLLDVGQTSGGIDGTVRVATLTGDGTGILTGYNRAVEDHTADNTLTSAESQKVNTNLGDVDLQTQTLPASPATGDTYTFTVVAAFEMRIDPQVGDHLIYSGGSMADGEYLSSSTVGSTLTVTALSDDNWVVTGEQGTWTEETP